MIEDLLLRGGIDSMIEALALAELSQWNRKTALGRVFSSSAVFTLADGSIMHADASWISEDCWRTLTRKEQRDTLPICPEFVVELFARGESKTMLTAKMQFWIDGGAKLAWLIDPYAATLTIYRPYREPEVLERPDSVEADGPVAGFRLTTASLWDDSAS